LTGAEESKITEGGGTAADTATAAVELDTIPLGEPLADDPPVSIVLEVDRTDGGMLPEVDGEGTNNGSERDLVVTLDDTKLTG